MDTLFIDIDDIAFLMTGTRDYFARPWSPHTKAPDPEYRKVAHEQTKLDGHAGLDIQLGAKPEPNEQPATGPAAWDQAP